MVTPIIVALIAVRLVALRPNLATSIVVMPTSLRIVNRNGRSFALFVRSEDNIRVALAWKFHSQRWQ